MSDFYKFIEENYPAAIERKSWGKESDISCAFCGKICWKGNKESGHEISCCEERKQSVLQQRIYKDNAQQYARGERERRYYEMIKRSGIDGRYLDVSFKKFLTNNNPMLEDALKKCNDFLESDKLSLILMGGVGVGKTHLAISAVKKHVWTKAEEARVIFQDSEIKDSDYRASLVCIDDIGREAGSERFLDFRRGLIKQIIDARNRNRLKTIYTTNATKSELMTLFGEHTSDRMFEKSEVVIISVKSWRQDV